MRIDHPWVSRIAWPLAFLVAVAPVGFLVYLLNVHRYDPAGYLEIGREYLDREPASFERNAGFDQTRVSPGRRSYSLNLSTATFALDAKAPDRHGRRVFPSHAAALRYAREHGLSVLPSVGLVRAKAKAFDDRALARIEREVQEGNASPEQGTRAFLSRLLERLAALRAASTGEAAEVIDRALVHLVTALVLGGESPTGVAPEVAAEAARAAARFEGDPEGRSASFYEGDPDLERIWRQDRFLQLGRPWDLAVDRGVVLSWAIGSDPELARAYERLAAIRRRLAGSPRCPTPEDFLSVVRDLSPGDLFDAHGVRDSIRRRLPPGSRSELIPFALFGSVQTHEEAAFAHLSANDPDARFMGSIVAALKSGAIDLTPEPGDGWYQYSVHALETLVRFERSEEVAKLRLSAAYRERLEEAFSAALAGSRESFAKFCGGFLGGKSIRREPEEIELAPEFTVEPMPTVYLRSGRAYRFARRSLEDLLPGSEVLGELDRMGRLLFGLALVSFWEMGLPPRTLGGELEWREWGPDLLEARAWLANLDADPDLAKDARVATPVSPVWPEETTRRFWGVFGVRLRPVAIEFEHEPVVDGPVAPRFIPARRYVVDEVFGEFSLPAGAGLTRAEFRRRCDLAAGDFADLEREFGLTFDDRPSGEAEGFDAAWCVAGSIAVAMALWAFLDWRRVRWRFPLAMAKQGTVAVLAIEILLAALYFAWPRARAEIVLVHFAPHNYATLYHASYLLEGIPAESLEAAYASALESDDPDVRYAALTCAYGPTYGPRLASDPPAAALEALLEKEDDPRIAALALDGLEPSAAPRVERVLARHPDSSRVAAACVWAWVRFQTDASWRRAFEFVDDPRDAVSREAVWRLSGFWRGADRARQLVPRVVEAVRAEDPGKIQAFLDRLAEELTGEWFPMRVRNGEGVLLGDLLRAIGGDRAERLAARCLGAAR